MSTPRTTTYAALGVATVTAAALGLGMSARGSEPAAAATPEWFKPIAASYGNDPRMTPDFDFASLYGPSLPKWFEGIAAAYGNDPRLTPEFDFASLYGPTAR